MKIESRADADHHGGTDATKMFVHPVFLLRRTQAHPDDIGLCVVDRSDDAFIFFFRERAVRRRIEPCDLQSRTPSCEPVGELLWDTFRASVKIVTVSLGQRLPANGQRQVGSADALDPRKPFPAAKPNERHAVRRDKAGLIMNLPEFFVLLTSHDSMHVSYADILPIALADPAVDRFEGLCHVDRTNPDSKDVDLRD